MNVVGHDPGLAAAVLVDFFSRPHLDQAVLYGDLDAEAAEFPLGIDLMSAKILGSM